jgi:hypothetical protein
MRKRTGRVKFCLWRLRPVQDHRAPGVMWQIYNVPAYRSPRSRPLQCARCGSHTRAIPPNLKAVVSTRARCRIPNLFKFN